MPPPAAMNKETRTAEELLHELQVHQVELEMQNEELRCAHAALEESSNRYVDLYDFAPVGYLTLTREGIIAEVNLTAAELLGMERQKLLSRRFAAFVAPKDGDRWHLFFSGIQKHNRRQNTDLTLKRCNNTEFHVHLDCLRVTSLGKDSMLRITLTDMTESRLVEALKVSEQRFRDLVNSTDGIVWEADAANFDFTFVSQQAESLLGYPVDDWLKPGFWLEHLHLDDTVWIHEFRAAFTHRLEAHSFEYRFIAKNGRTIWLRCFATVETENGVPRWLRGIMVDITQNKLDEQQLRIAATAFEAQEGIIITDKDNNILRVNQAFTDITGYTEQEVIGMNPRLLKSGRQNAVFYLAMWQSIHTTGGWSGEIWNRRKDNSIFLEHITITAVKDPNGDITNYVGTLTDITMSRAAADEIERLAFYDPLTGLPNRRLLQDRLIPALASSERNNLNGALLFIDLDNFKILNDTLGHDIGDLLLQKVAERLMTCVRQEDTVARLGGDEFVVILEDLSAQSTDAIKQTEMVGHKILATLNLPYQLTPHDYHITASIGATLFHGHKQATDELLKYADIAMYQAKATGRNALRFFDPQMQINITDRVSLETDLYLALAQNQFILYYQPQVKHNHQVFGAEVLIRWQHPQRGVVSPASFIPLAEETGLILPIGQWVLETACAQLKVWEGSVHTQHLQLAVNVSARQFHQAGFVGQIRQVLRYSGINPGRLKLELTESLVLDDIGNTIGKMQVLREIGVRFSMDDFGTGYSSLSYLTQLPLDQLKIDQSFVRNIGIKPTDAVIVQTIIGMADNLGIEVIAEGVETEEQRAFLELHGCLAIQGYLFGRPLPLDEFECLLRV